MKNPLIKRLPREAAGDASKYIAIFSMLVLLISICSGMRVGNESMKRAYYESFDRYQIEDGHVTFDKKLPQKLLKKLEKRAAISLYENMYFEEDIAETGATVRVYNQTDKRNTPCLLAGELPTKENEIAIDRVFAENNEIETGDSITLNGRSLMVSGLIALPHYSTLFEKNTDSMFDSINFTVAVMTAEGFRRTEGKEFYYNYAWVYGKAYADDIEAARRSDNLLAVIEEELTKYAMEEGMEALPAVEDYLPRYLNQAINFSIEDIGGDEAMVMVLCYMMIGVIAFIFAVTISNTIVAEAGAIGTLRASGYTKGELIRHYMSLPVIVTLLAAVVGNIVGYTVMKDYFVKLYRASYSLTAYSTVWDSSAFLISTLVPVILMLLINLTVLIRRLRLSPIQFLRRDLKKHKNKRAIHLNRKIPFKMRFSLRIFFSNFPGYIVMIVGILFGALLISFGDMLPRMIDSYKEIIVQDMISEHQYVLYDSKKAVVADAQAEKYASSSFDYTKEGFLTDSITVYGIEKNSRYVSCEIPKGKAMISTGMSEKFGLKEGDVLKLDEKYKKNTSYEIEVGGVYDYRSSLALFMNREDFNETFNKEVGSFTGYFSNDELTELSEEEVVTVITAEDYTKLSDQLSVSMGGMTVLVKWFGAIFFVIVVYVLCKQVIERNFQSIALSKILGFKSSEIGMLYIASTAIAVVIGLLLTVPVVDVFMRLIFDKYLYTVMTGYIPCRIGAETYIVTIATGLLCFAVVALLQLRKVSKVSKSEALKNVE